MSIENAKKVMHFAVAHPSFRASFRANPSGALDAFKDRLDLSKDGLTLEEMDALVDITDADYAALQRIAVGLGEDFSSEGHTGGVIL